LTQFDVYEKYTTILSLFPTNHTMARWQITELTTNVQNPSSQLRCNIQWAENKPTVFLCTNFTN